MAPSLDCDDLFSGETWAPCEVEYLENLYGHVANVEIALDLKRSINAVGAKAHTLGLNAKTYQPRAPRVRGSLVARRALGLALRRYFNDAL